MATERYDMNRVIALLRLNQASGLFGSTEIFWNDHEIVGIKQNLTFKPHELPPVVQPT